MRACKSLSHEKVSMFGVCVCFFLFECVCVVFVSVCMHLPVLANNKTSLNRGMAAITPFFLMRKPLPSLRFLVAACFNVVMKKKVQSQKADLLLLS